MLSMSNHVIHVTIHGIHGIHVVIYVIIYVLWSSKVSYKAFSIKSGGGQNVLSRPLADIFAVGQRQKPKLMVLIKYEILLKNQFLILWFFLFAFFLIILLPI
jgi:hypothetical protein